MGKFTSDCHVRALISRTLPFLILTTSSAGAGDYYSQNLTQARTSLLWGDTHVHTAYSSDAYTLGNATLTPEDAYRFARGEIVLAANGKKVRLRRPLDFIVVADHGEYLGLIHSIATENEVIDSTIGARWKTYIDRKEYAVLLQEAVEGMISSQDGEKFSARHELSIWQKYLGMAEKYNRPGFLTTFPAYEWTSMSGGNNLHRVVIFRESTETLRATLPFTASDSSDPEDLWRFLERYQTRSQSPAIAIPHNGNFSNGLMFIDRKVNGQELDRDYAAARARWEPVVEITQMKGDSETHPVLSPNDEFADFERIDTGNIVGSAPKKDWMLQYEYGRRALTSGLKQHRELGINPFKFGMIGSSDTHVATPSTEEQYFLGTLGTNMPAPGRAMTRLSKEYLGKDLWPNWKLSASGLAAVWATENSRTSIFDAIKRREVYATTGPRISVRFFGGWSYQTSDVQSSEFVAIGYDRGVSMGGDLVATGQRDAPSFMVAAAKDPDGANLDRIQIIKGWLDAKGGMHEKIYDIALSDRRTIDSGASKQKSVGTTVDVSAATYSNSIGAAELRVVWTDPDFDMQENAYYYARVIEIPKPRWTAYDSLYFGDEMSSEVPMTIQDRAYTSPIWYTP